MINLDTNETICTSCPVFGTEPEIPGQEDGYVVKIADDDLTPPYVIQPGTRIRVQVGISTFWHTVSCVSHCIANYDQYKHGLELHQAFKL